MRRLILAIITNRDNLPFLHLEKSVLLRIYTIEVRNLPEMFWQGSLPARFGSSSSTSPKIYADGPAMRSSVRREE